MRFIDEAIIQITAGHGGSGAVSFRREKYIPRGGPDGGNGGRGGSIDFESSTRISTLQDFRYKRKYLAQPGASGEGGNRSGSDGDDLLIYVPVGTTLTNTETGDILQDFTEPGQRFRAATGGRGGKGNAHFATATHQAPKFSQPGELGTFCEIKLELKLIADAGIIGFPNAGKSSLISKMSAAKPKIGDYPFTTLKPNLGVVSLSEDRPSFVVADIPGLIEGAHQGTGLGHKFLKHIERTRVLVHLLDGAKFLEDATSPAETADAAVAELAHRYEVIRSELEAYNPHLVELPEIVALNKVDLLASDPKLLQEAHTALKEKIGNLRQSPLAAKEPFLISTATGEGVQELIGLLEVKVTESREQK